MMILNPLQFLRLWVRMVLVGLSVAAPVFAGEAPGTFTFVHIADTQFGMYESDRSFEAETANYEKVVTEINRLKPAFVVIGGDLINKAGDAAQIAEFKRITGKISPDIPVHLVEGNHDVGNTPTPELMALYRKNFGENYYTFRYRDFVGVVVDTNLISAPDLVSSESDAQFTWLQGEMEKLKTSDARYKFVFIHQPFFLSTAVEPNNGFLNVAVDRRAKYLDLMRAAGVTHILAGHLHRYNEAKDGSLNMIAVGAVGRPPNGTASGMALVTVGPAGVDYHYYTLDQLPIAASSPATPGGSSGAPTSGSGRSTILRIM